MPLIISIGGHENNFTLIRLILSASIIYYHSFGMTKSHGYADHLTAILMPVTTVGGLAVQSFFFLSGIFVTQSYFRDQNVINFTIKRALRIWPGLFVCVCSTAFIGALISRPEDFYKFLSFEGLYNYIFQNSIFNLTWFIEGVFEQNTMKVVNGSIHTLPLEIKMYIILAVVGMLGFLKTPLRIIAISITLIGLCFVPGTIDRLPIRLFNAEYARTAAVMFLAGVLTFGCSRWISIYLWQGVLLGAAVWVTTGLAHFFCFYIFVGWILLYLGQCPLGEKLSRPKRDISYGVYLYGWPSQQLVMVLFPDINPYTLMVLGLIVASVFSLLSWRLIEEPAILVGKSISKKNSFNQFVFLFQSKGGRSLAYVMLIFTLISGVYQFGKYYDLRPVTELGIKIDDFGPRDSIAGQSINTQSNGESAIWLKIKGTTDKKISVIFDGIKLETEISQNLVTAKIPRSLLATAGNKKIYMESRSIDYIQRSDFVILKIVSK